MEFFDDTAVVLPFVADASAAISATLSWDSEISTALRGKEERGGFRAYPRPKLEFSARTCSVAQTADLRARVQAAFDRPALGAGTGRVAVPWQARGCWLAADAAVGAVSLALEPTPWPWRNADGWIAFPDAQSAAASKNWQYGRTTGIDETFALGLSAPLAAALPAGAVIYPLFIGRLDLPDRASLITDAYLRQPLSITGGRQFIDATSVPTACGGGMLTNFDFAIIRYQWGSMNGTDLDTRTKIISPDVDGEVGWDRGNVVTGSGTTNLLSWGGDNTTPTGAEAILVDFPAIAAAYPDAATITIRLRANWYNIRGDGNFNVQFATYLGGTMTGPTAYDFVNVGGVAVQTINVARNVISHTASNADGDDCGHLVYNTAARSAFITG